MPHLLTKKQLLQELNHHYSDDSLLLVDIWSSMDVEIQLDPELDIDSHEDKAMDIWADIAEEFASAFDHTTSMLNDTLYELIQENQ